MDDTDPPPCTNADRTSRLGRVCACEVDADGRVVFACPWCLVEFAAFVEGWQR